MGWLPKNYNNSIEMNKQRDNIKHKFVSKLQTFIESVKSKYDIIIFTKDRHPIGHRSFGTYPPHCINVSKTCKINYILHVLIIIILTINFKCLINYKFDQYY